MLRRKINTLLKDPVGAIKSKATAEVRYFLHYWASRKLRENGVLEPLSAFLAARPPNAYAPDMPDLWFLYQTVRQRRPSVILEFGSGCSTVVLTQALWENQRGLAKSSGSLYSVDADPYWAEITAKAIPAQLSEYCRISYSPLLEVSYKGILAYRHACVPDVNPNFVYLDGPALTPERQVAIDILDMEGKLPSDFYMVIDGRSENALFLKNNMTRRYKIKERKNYRNRVFELIA